MAYKVEELLCEGCAEPLAVEQTKCPSCGREVVISTFNSVYGISNTWANKIARNCSQLATQTDRFTPEQQQEINCTIAMCYLKLRLYDKALNAFEKTIEYNFDNSEVYFYAAVCILNGKKPFLLSRVEIDKAIEYINAAIMIEPKGIYHYLLAYIKYDYFERKFLRTSPDYREELKLAEKWRYSPSDVKQLFEILGVEKPNSF